jgi:hypothetical protein
LSETRGFIKVLVEANGDRILGFTMIGSEAGEVMAMVQTAMLAGLPHTRLRDAIVAHPTMAEGPTRCLPIYRSANGSVGSRQYRAGRCRGTHVGRRNNW